MLDEAATKASTPLPVELAGREAELRAKLESDRAAAFTLAAITAVLAAANVAMYVAQTSGWGQAAGWTAFALFALTTVGFLSGRTEKNVELQKIKAQRSVYSQLAGGSAESAVALGGGAGRDEDYFRNLVTINVTNLREYYFLVKTHTHASFRTALAVGLIGFALIVVGVALGYKGEDKTFSLVASAAGVITEFIASVFFYLYNRTVRQLKEYHDSLLDVQDVLLALKVLESLQDPATKSDVVKSVVKYLMEGSRKLRATAPGAGSAE